MIGAMIRRERRQQHLSQQDLANRLHCDRSLVSLIETEKKQPTPEFLKGIEQVLVVDWTQIEATMEPENSIVRQAQQGVRTGQWTEGQLLAETAWWECLQRREWNLADDAFDVWLETLSHHPSSPAILSLALTYLMQKAASHDWDHLFPMSIRLQHRLLQINQITLAEAVSQAVLVLSPPLDVVCPLHIGLGTAALRSDRLEDATYYYRRAEREWNPALSSLVLGRCYHGLGATAILLHQWDLAQQAIHLYHHQDHALYYAALQNLGFVYGHTGQSSQAAQIFQQCLDFWTTRAGSDRLASLRAALIESGIVSAQLTPSAN